MIRTPFHVTDHALLRYIERVKGLDIEAARAEVAQTIKSAQEHRGCSGVTSNGFRYVLMNGVLVTIKRIDSNKGRADRARQVKL